jgi:serine/threonine protein kinase
LGDDENVIVTVPRVGYKLAAPVHCKSTSSVAVPELRLFPGQPVPGRDQWRLTRRLDASPSSDVWVAEHPKTRETRVFKFAPDGVRLKSLKREITVARLLRESLGDRPEFVRALEWNFESHPYFVESEYVGPNLVEWADIQGGLGKVPLDVRVQLLTDVARAVAAAHELDILHKDLKPANVLLASTPDGRPQIKVADFGSASLVVPERLAALGITNLGFTQTGANDGKALTGTLMYIAPEVLSGQLPTAASDVYSLGVLLYQLVAGDFRKPIAPGWEADLSDPILREDVADSACGDPSRRLKSVQALVERLVNLDRRRAEREELDRQRDPAAAAALKRTHARARRPWLALAGLVVLAAGIAGVLNYRSAGSAVPEVRVVAVLPLQNTRADPDIDFLGLALADEITTALSHIHGLQVRPISATTKYAGSARDVQAIGRELRVDDVVTGHYSTADGHLRVSLEAFDPNSNRVTWRDSFEAPKQSLIAAQVQIALRIRGGLAPALGASAMDTVAEPRNEEAFELYLRSVALPMVTSTSSQALDMLERAVKLDPDYPPAWLALGRRYYAETRYGTADASMMDRYAAALEQALSLDPNYVPAAAGLIVSRVEQGDLVNAHSAATELVKRRPDSVDAQFVLSYVLRYAGLLKDAGDRCEEALLLDRKVQTSGIRTCAIVFMLRGDYPRTQNYLRLDEGSDFIKALTLDMLARQGKTQEAQKLGSPNVPGWKSSDLLLACLARNPSTDVAAVATSVTASDDPELNYLAAARLAYCGRSEAAADLLHLAIRRNYCSYPAMDSDPLLANLRATPQYAEIRAAGRACQERFLAGRDRRSR